MTDSDPNRDPHMADHRGRPGHRPGAHRSRAGRRGTGDRYRSRPGLVGAADDPPQRLDVVVNNARYGLVGAIEEIDEGAARAIADTNTFAALWVTQAALPHLRRQGCQHPTRRMGHFRVPTSVVASRNGASSSTGRRTTSSDLLAPNPRLPEPRILTSVAFAHPVAAGLACGSRWKT